MSYSASSHEWFPTLPPLHDFWWIPHWFNSRIYRVQLNFSLFIFSLWSWSSNHFKELKEKETVNQMHHKHIPFLIHDIYLYIDLFAVKQVIPIYKFMSLQVVPASWKPVLLQSRHSVPGIHGTSLNPAATARHALPWRLSKCGEKKTIHICSEVWKFWPISPVN